MTRAEQFAILNTSNWMPAFQAKVDEIQASLITASATVESFSFELNGIACKIINLENDEILAQVGTDDSGNWMYQITVPSEWL